MIEYTVNGGILTVSILGEIDHHSAAELRKEIDALIRSLRPTCLILDFERVGFCDSSGIAVVLGRYRLMQSIGGVVELTRLPENVRAVFEMADLKRLVRIA